MKKSLSLAFLASLLVLFGCAKTPSTPGTDDLSATTTEEAATAQTYESKTDKFTLQFPATRTFEENVYGSSVMFFTPLAQDDKLRENIGIVKKTLDKEYTLDEYYTLTKPELQNLIPNFVEVSNETIKIKDMNAQKLIYQGTQGEVKLQWAQVYLIKNKVVYIITYTATEDTFNEFIKNVDDMVATLELK